MTLLRQINNVYHAADNKSRTLLIQLDLSSVFDKIDSGTLFGRIKRSVDWTGVTSGWICSYIEGRKQFT
jgi:hypothetical protein